MNLGLKRSSFGEQSEHEAYAGDPIILTMIRFLKRQVYEGKARRTSHPAKLPSPPNSIGLLTYEIHVQNSANPRFTRPRQIECWRPNPYISTRKVYWNQCKSKRRYHPWENLSVQRFIHIIIRSYIPLAGKPDSTFCLGTQILEH